jgi:L-lysine exporter family protein LysE/ArgO
MVHALAIGFALGFVAGIPVGPVNAAVIDTAMRKCVRRAIAIGVGGAFMDFVYSQLAVLGLGTVMQAYPWLQNAFLGVGGVVLVVFGVKSVLAPPPIDRDDRHLHDRKPLVVRALAAAFLGGVLITVANPAALISWLLLAGTVLADFKGMEALVSGLGIFFGCTAWFLIVAYLAGLGRVKLGVRARWITRGVGAALLGYGIFLVGKASFVVLAHP